MGMDLKVTLHRQYMYFRSRCISVCGWVSAYMRVCVCMAVGVGEAGAACAAPLFLSLDR